MGNEVNFSSQEDEIGDTIKYTPTYDKPKENSRRSAVCRNILDKNDQNNKANVSNNYESYNAGYNSNMSTNNIHARPGMNL
jgi:hypothetical protein